MNPVIFSTQAPDFNASLTAREPSDLVLTLIGSAENDVRELLPTVLSTTDDAARSRQATRVEVDFRQLEFMSSSCFKEFVAWLSKIKTRADPEQYRVILHSSKDIRWQRASLFALSCFAANVVEIQTE